jgi:phage terminase large subunit
MTTYQIVEARQDSKIGYQPYGNAVKVWRCKDREFIFIGPAETGKTRVTLEKLNALAWKYPNLQAAMIRKVYGDAVGSCLQTFERKVLGDSLGDDGPVIKYGGEKPQFYQYPNGSRIWVGGLDKPGKTLSSERDFIYVNQVEELTSEDWEILTTRATGRAGNSPYTQVFGDANPTVCSHWMYERERTGGLNLIQSRHEDNPTLFDPATGQITEQGKVTLAILDGLTGVRYTRLRLGKCANVEGQVYGDWDRDTNLIDPFPIPATWRRYRAIDFGTVHPFVCLWAAADEDSRLYVYRQIYQTNRTVTEHSTKINGLGQGERIDATVCDHDAGDRLTLTKNGIPNQAAKKDVLVGIGKVQDRLKKQIDGRPRLFVFRNSLVEIDQALKMSKKPFALEQEFDNYVWANNQKEAPVKDYDHGLDALRYIVMHIDSPRGWVR